MNLGPSENIKRVPLPDIENIDEVELALLKDENDADKGWTELIVEEEDGLMGSARNVGLKDGGVVAFMFGGMKGFGVKFPSYEDAYPEEGDEGMV